MSTDWWETFQYSAIMVDLRFIINNKMDQKPIWNWWWFGFNLLFSFISQLDPWFGYIAYNYPYSAVIYLLYRWTPTAKWNGSILKIGFGIDYIICCFPSAMIYLLYNWSPTIKSNRCIFQICFGIYNKIGCFPIQTYIQCNDGWWCWKAHI